jgi:hypothetical protein
MIEEGRAMLGAGRAVVLDATFIDPALRARAEQLARDCGVPFRAAWLDAPFDVLEERVSGRKGDASDATLEILREQVARLSDPVSWPRVDATAPANAAAKAWIAG